MVLLIKELRPNAKKVNKALLNEKYKKKLMKKWDKNHLR